MRRPTFSFTFALVLVVVSILAVAGHHHAFVVPTASSQPPRSLLFVPFGQPVAIAWGRNHHDKTSIFLQKEDDVNDDDHKEQENSNKPPSEVPAPLSPPPGMVTKGTRPAITPIFDNLNRAVFAFGIFFIVSSFILESFGYAYVIDNDNHLSINTLDYRNFQLEVIKAAKAAKDIS
jgi:hypothetical protein